VTKEPARIRVAENEPRIAFFSDSAFDVDIKPLRSQGSLGLLKYRQFEDRCGQRPQQMVSISKSNEDLDRA
jgi:hypothetical protein